MIISRENILVKNFSTHIPIHITTMIKGLKLVTNDRKKPLIWSKEGKP
jgi:hypothetical protein